MKIELLMVILGLSSLLASANNIVTVEGKLTSITSTHYVVETKDNSYFIDRKAIPESYAEKMDRTEVDVSLQIPMEAIQRVKSRLQPPKKKK